jgi:hypothetical protein
MIKGTGTGNARQNPRLSRAQIVHQGLAAMRAPFADPVQTELLIKHLDPLLAAGAQVRFSNHTGLMRTLRGDLWPEERATDPDTMRRIAAKFLERHQLGLFGAEGQAWIEVPGSAVGSTVCYRQVSAAGMPVYGTQARLDFDNAGALRMVVINWYPLKSRRDQPQLRGRDEACQMAIKAVRQEASGQDEPTSELVLISGDKTPDGPIVMPLFDQPGNYRTAWVVHVSDPQRGQAWEVIVDAEGQDGADAQPAAYQNPILGIAPLAYRAAVPIYESSSQASDQFPNPLQSVPLATLSAAFPGLSAATMDGSDGPTNNAWYHLGVAANYIEKTIARAWIGSGAPPPPSLPGRAGGQPLNLSMVEKISFYDRINKRINLNPDGPHPHAYDAKVVYHEYSHAVFNALEPDLVNANQPGQFCEAINEGLAFYLACSISARAPTERNPTRWGDFAYNCPADLDLERSVGQRPGFDYAPHYGIYPSPPDMAYPFNDSRHAVGMILARAIWDMSRILGRELTDSAILRAIPLLGGIHTEFETALEVIIHSADVLLDNPGATGFGPVEHALRMIFSSRGLIADGPVNDLQHVVVGGAPLALAAIESTVGKSGCLYSKEATTWSPLGQGGLVEVQKLAVIGCDAESAIILAVGATWEQDKKFNRVYRYTLNARSGGAETGIARLILTRAWQPVGDQQQLATMIGEADILAITGSQDSSGSLRTFIGTERGLFEHNGQSWREVRLAGTGEAQNMLAGQAIFSIAAVQKDNEVVLLLGCQEKRITETLTYKHELIAITPDPAGQAATRQSAFEQGTLPTGLILALRPTWARVSNYADATVWATTADGRVHRYQDQGVGWSKVGLLLDLPIYCLLADPQQNEPEAVVLGSSAQLWRLAHPDQANLPRAQPFQPQLNGLTITALGRGPAGEILVGTLEQGLYRLAGQSWERMLDGLSRVGRQADFVTTKTGTWEYTWKPEQALALDDAATLVIFLPVKRSQITLEDVGGAQGVGAQITLFYAPSEILPNNTLPLPAGIVKRGTPLSNPETGFYIISVVAQQPLATFELRIVVS